MRYISDLPISFCYFAMMIQSDYQKWATDVNNDGIVRADYVILILRAAAGLMTQYLDNVKLEVGLWDLAI